MSSLKRSLKNNKFLYSRFVRTRHLKNVLFQLVSDQSLRVETLNQHLHPHDYILCHWAVSTNFGDAISPILVQALSKKTPLPIERSLDLFRRASYSVIGSILQYPATPRTEVWGSGFIQESGKFPVLPSRIHAVRGPLTREICLREGLTCPEIYGDPAVLVFDKFVNLPRRRTHRVGFIPHYYDSSHPTVQQFSSFDDVKVIDVHSSVREIAEACLTCDVIVSSSLHGLILADALQIPSRWLGVSDVVLKGGFKFQDYFRSVHREEPEPLPIGLLTVERAIKEAHLRIEPFSREALLEACPFRHCSIGRLEDVVFEQFDCAVLM